MRLNVLIKIADKISINGQALTKTGSSLDSNPGGFFIDEKGQEFYLKYHYSHSVLAAERFENEFLALKLYELFKIPVPDSTKISFFFHGVEFKGIKTARLKLKTVQQRFGEEGKLIKRLNVPTEKLEEFRIFQAEAQKGFLVDAWLANWDVVGLESDNLSIADFVGQQAIRLDTGGALFYRAQGTSKGEAFSATVSEFTSLLSETINPQARKIFYGVNSTSKLKECIDIFLSASDEEIKQCIDTHGFSDKHKNATLHDLLLTAVQKRG